VQELIKNQDTVRRFSGQLDLTKQIQIVKKKKERPAVVAVEPKTTGLRFIRPPQVNSAAPIGPAPGIQSNQIQFIRPNQRVPAPVVSQQQNFVYVQTTQANYIQVQNSVQRAPGMLQMVTRQPTPVDQADKAPDTPTSTTNQVRSLVCAWTYYLRYLTKSHQMAAKHGRVGVRGRSAVGFSASLFPIKSVIYLFSLSKAQGGFQSELF